MRNLLFFCLLYLLSWSNGFAQSDSVRRIDSLSQVLKKPLSDKDKVKTLMAITEACYGSAPSKSKKFADEAKKLSEAIGYLDGMANSYGWLAFLFEQEGRINEALVYYNQALAISKKTGNKKDQGTILNNIAAIYKDQGKIIEALNYNQQSLELAKESGNRNGISSTYNNIGLIYASQGKISEALDYYSRSLKIEEEQHNTDGISTALGNIAMVYKDQHEYGKAKEYLLRALKINTESNDKYATGYTYNTLGTLYADRGDQLRALDYFNKALAVRREIDDKQGIAYSLKNVGNSYMKLGNIAGAETESLEHFGKLGDKLGLTLVNNLLGETMRAKGMAAAAENYFGKSLQLAQQLGYPMNISDAAKNLQQLYREKNRWKDALAMNDIYIQMRDSIQNMNNRTAAIRTQFKYDYEKKEREQKIAQAKLLAEEQRRQNIQYALISLGILVFIVLFLLVSHMIIATPKIIRFFGVITLLVVFEFINLLIHPFLGKMTHHSAFLMLLAMVCLASLLVPMHHKIEKWATTTLIEKNKRIRLASAKKTLEELENDTPVSEEDNLVT